MPTTRRDFLKMSMLFGAAAAVPNVAPDYPVLPGSEPAPIPHGPEAWKAGTCTACGAGCGVLVRVIDGRAVGIRGNPDHPISRGTLCPRGAAELGNLYHPDRLHKPMVRHGGKDGQLEPSSWDEALSLVAERLKPLPAGSLILLGRDSTDLASYLVRRLALTFSPATFCPMPWTLSQPPLDALEMIFGQADGWVYDVAHAGAVFSFGWDWLQASPSPVETQRLFGELRRGRPDRRPRIVQIEPRMSITGMHADEWVAVAPGACGALALAMACVIVREHLENTRFLAKHAAAFEDLRNYLMEGCDPAALSKAADVPEEEIRRLAREFASARPGLALCGRGRLSDQMIVLALNALVGSFGEGGVRAYRPPRELRAERPPGPAPAAESVPEIVLRQPGRVRAMMLDRANPAFLSPSPQRWRDALRKTPFVVSLSEFVDESSSCADVVLPLATAIESWNAVARTSCDGTSVLSVSEPAIDRRHDTRSAADIVLELAKRLGGPSAAALHWPDAEHALRDQLAHVAGEGWTRFPGGWQRPSQTLEPAFAKTWSALSRWEESPVECTEDFPLHLQLSASSVYPEGRGGHIPLLAGQFGSHVNQAWETWVEVNPETAKRLHIQPGDRVKVATEAGEVLATVAWYPGIRPDVISMPVGLGHETFGGAGRQVGSNPARLIPARLCPGSGQPIWLAAAAIRKEA